MKERAVKCKRIIESILYKKSNEYMKSLLQSRPIDLNVEVVNRCVLKCKFCVNRYDTSEQIVMPVDLLEKITSEYVEKWGGGGMSISSDQSDFFMDPLFDEHLEILASYKDSLKLHLATPLITAKKYNDEQIYKLLSIFDHIGISAQGYDPASYKEMTGVDAFEVLEEQIERICRIKREHNLPINITIINQTYDVDKFKGTAFYRKQMQLLGKENIGVNNTYFSWSGKIKQEDLPSGSILVNTNNEDKRINCIVPNTTMFIQADGKVLGCGCIDWYEKYIIGDVNVQTLDEIWHSDRCASFQNAFSSKKAIPSICQDCNLYAELKFNEKRWLKYTPSYGCYYLWQ